MAKAKAKKKGKKGKQAKQSKGKKARKASKSKARKGAAKKKKSAARKKITPRTMSYSEPAPAMASDTTPEVTTFASDMSSSERSPMDSSMSEETTYGEYTGRDDSSSSSSSM